MRSSTFYFIYSSIIISQLHWYYIEDRSSKNELYRYLSFCSLTRDQNERWSGCEEKVQSQLMINVIFARDIFLPHQELFEKCNSCKSLSTIISLKKKVLLILTAIQPIINCNWRSLKVREHDSENCYTCKLLNLIQIQISTMDFTRLDVGRKTRPSLSLLMRLAIITLRNVWRIIKYNWGGVYRRCNIVYRDKHRDTQLYIIRQS